jgi:hypothetical protein
MSSHSFAQGAKERHCCTPAVAAAGGAQYVAAIKDAQARSMGYVIAMPLQKTQ